MPNSTILRIIGEELSWLNPVEVTPDAMLGDIGFDQIDAASLALRLEDEFRVTIPDAELATWASVADVVRAVEGMV